MKISKFLLIGGLILSSHLHAAEIQSHKIFDALSKSNQSQHEVIKSETKSLYDTLFKKLKNQGITTLEQNDIPLNVQITPQTSGSMSHLKFTAFADNDGAKEGIRVVYNPNGQIAPPVTAGSLDFVKQQQVNLHDGNYLEFTILHELGHMQHDKLGYMNPKSIKEMTKDELSFINKEKEKDYHKSLDGRHQEQIADMLAAVWLVKINNFSDESIQTIKSFKDNRANDLQSIQSKNGKDIISYDTAGGLDFVLNHLEDIKKLDNSNILDYVSYQASNLAKEYASNHLHQEKNIANIDNKTKYVFNLSNMQQIRQNSLTKTTNKLKI